MATTNFISGTVITADWLNDADEAAYGLITFPRGEGTGANGYVSEIKYQILDNDNAPDQMATFYTRRTTTHSSGTSGYVSSGIRSDLYINGNSSDYNWAITGMVDSSSIHGQNVGGYFQGKKRASAGPVWGATIEVLDYTGADPTTGAVGLEIDVSGNGTDANINRVGINIWAKKTDTGGADNTVAFGIRLDTEAGNSYAIGYDTSQATILQASYKLAQGQVIAFNSAATKQLSYDGTGLKYSPDSGSTLAVRLNDAGNIQIGSNQVVGARDTGWTAMTGTTNKATAYDTSTVTLAQLAGRVMALQAALTTHGLIGA